MNLVDLKKKHVSISHSDEDDGKLEFGVRRQAQGAKPGDRIAVVMKVAKEGYVPDGVKVRARISPRLFTAEMARRDMRRVRRDVHVVSIGTPKAIRPI